MQNITNNEMLFILSIFKNVGEEYNANNIAKHLGISSMGALKIARRLEGEKVIVSKILGRAKFYRINFNNDYAKHYIKFLLKRESEGSSAYVKRWIKEVRKIKSAEIGVLFGSVLRKGNGARDIDALFVVDKKRFGKLKKEIEEINLISDKKLHPMYQTKEDLIRNIKEGDKPLLNALKGIVVFGEEGIIDLIGGMR